MNDHPERHHRRSIRLRGFDYSQPGAYFVTVVTQERACLFGEVARGEIRLNEYGEIVRAYWNDLPRHYPNVGLDAFCVMPNHVHGIIVLVRAGFKPAPTGHALTEIIRAFKTFSARRINAIRKRQRVALWQRNYYEHIIRDGDSLDRIRNYIAENPLRWDSDRENPLAVSADTAPPRRDEPWRV